MHLVIPFAAPGSDVGRDALRALQAWGWPGLATLISALSPVPSAQRNDASDASDAAPSDGDEFGLTPPHERVIAQARGWRLVDGALPWAASQLRALGHDPGLLAWGLLTPAHWHLGTTSLSMGDPTSLMLDEATSQALLAAIAPLFTSEGFDVRWGAASSWFIAHSSLADMPCASLDRVIGRNVDRWLPSGKAARLLRRLQIEAQMVFYTHPMNAQREQRGLLPVNSFWLSGCGVAQPEVAVATKIETRLRLPALNEDWAAWCAAWQQIDGDLAGAGVGADINRLTLCGERSTMTWEVRPRSAWQRLAARWQRVALAPLLETL